MRCSPGTGVGVGVGDPTGLGVAVGLGVGVGATVGVGVLVGVAVAVGSGVAVGVGVAGVHADRTARNTATTSQRRTKDLLLQASMHPNGETISIS